MISRSLATGQAKIPYEQDEHVAISQRKVAWTNQSPEEHLYKRRHGGTHCQAVAGTHRLWYDLREATRIEGMNRCKETTVSVRT
jgi:hypothetical protein